MKKLLLIAAALFVGLQANAQLVAEGGYLHAFDTYKFSGNTTTWSSDLDGIYLGGKWQIGLDGITDGLGIAPGANLSFLFGKFQGISNLSEREIDLNIPVLVTYEYDLTSDFGIMGMLGPNLQLGLLNHVVARNGASDTSYNLYKEQPALGTSARSAFNLYITLGVGIEVAKMIQVNVGFDWGLLNLSTDSYGKLTRNALRIGVGYIF